jgi:hypothetical protein
MQTNPTASLRARTSPPGGGLLGIPVPAAGRGTCHTCHGPTCPGDSRCWCCRHVGRVLGPGPSTVVPMALYRPGDQLHKVLRGYKDAGSATTRQRLAARLAAMSEQFLWIHGSCLTAAVGPVDALCVVPPSRRRPGLEPPPAGHRGCQPYPGPPVAPLLGVLDQVESLSGLPRLALTRTAGTTMPRHLWAPPDAYAVCGTTRPGTRVLLLDDTWTTGAHVRSATAALTDAGIDVAGVLVAGRCIEPSASPTVSRWWQQAVYRTVIESRQTRTQSGAQLPTHWPTRPCCLMQCWIRRLRAGAQSAR